MTDEKLYPDVSPTGLIAVRCPGVRRLAGAYINCRHTLAEVPPSWCPVVVLPVPNRTTVSGKARLEKCEQCGTWLEVSYQGLLAA